MKSTTILLITAFLSFGLTNYASAKTPSIKSSTTKQNTQIISVNLNKADAKEIAKVLKGIGIKKAQAIVDYRKKHGDFKAVEEIASVKGIGVSTIAKNHKYIRLK